MRKNVLGIIMHLLRVDLEEHLLLGSNLGVAANLIGSANNSESHFLNYLLLCIQGYCRA